MDNDNMLVINCEKYHRNTNLNIAMPRVTKFKFMFNNV